MLKKILFSSIKIGEWFYRTQQATVLDRKTEPMVTRTGTWNAIGVQDNTRSHIMDDEIVYTKTRD